MIKAQSQLSCEDLGLDGLSARAAFLSKKSHLLKIFIDIRLRVIAFPRSKAKD